VQPGGVVDVAAAVSYWLAVQVRAEQTRSVVAVGHVDMYWLALQVVSAVHILADAVQVHCPDVSHALWVFFAQNPSQAAPRGGP